MANFETIELLRATPGFRYHEGGASIDDIYHLALAFQEPEAGRIDTTQAFDTAFAVITLQIARQQAGHRGPARPITLFDMTQERALAIVEHSPAMPVKLAGQIAIASYMHLVPAPIE